MNFHKTIGYLAALLLMVGLGVPDSFAQDEAGFRVLITKPGNGDWAKAGKTVTVQVHRHKSVALGWTKQDIKVALYDDKDADGKLKEFDGKEEDGDPLYSLNIVLSNLDAKSFPGVPTKPGDYAHEDGVTISGGKNLGDSKVLYKANPGGQYDILEIQLDLEAKTSDVDRVYAVATFGGSSTIESQDTTTLVFELGGITEKVGDGKYIKVDTFPPDGDLISDINVTISQKGGQESEDRKDSGKDIEQDLNVPADKDVYAGIGDTIKVNATATAFREKSVVFKLVSSEKLKETIGSDLGTIQKFDILNILANNKMEALLVVTEGAFKLTYKSDDKENEKKKGDLYKADNLEVKVDVTVADLANNQTAQVPKSTSFFLDSNPPKVTIKYPKPSGTDSSRFTEKKEDKYNFDGDVQPPAALRPLNFKVSEELKDKDGVDDVVKVMIGADTLTTPTNKHNFTKPDNPQDLSEAIWTQAGLSKDAKDESIGPVGKPVQGGSTVDLKIVVTDKAGNVGMGTPGGKVIYDAKGPGITVFPNLAALASVSNRIGGVEETQHPVVKVNEVADSIVVRYSSLNHTVTKIATAGQLSMVNQNVKYMFTGDDALINTLTYNLAVYAKDLAGHVTTTREQGLTFREDLNNPDAGGFDVSVAADHADSTQAGTKDIVLTITAYDSTLAQASGGKATNHPAITYAKAGVVIEAQDADGNTVSGVNYNKANGVTDNKNGTATLNANGWVAGARTVKVTPKTATNLIFVVKDMTNGVLNFDGKSKATMVYPNEVTKFVVTTEPADEVGVGEQLSFTVVPTDAYGNPSLREADGAGGKKYSDLDIDVTVIGLETIPVRWEIWDVGMDGYTSSVIAPASPGRNLTIQVRATAYTDIKGSATVKTVTPLTPVLAADMTGDIEIPATVTVTATGFNANSMVTFTVGDTAQDPVTADADGSASVEVAGTEAGTVTVSAASGQYSTDAISIVFVEAPAGRQSYADADGNPVYLIAKSSGTVGVDDFLALIAAFGSSDGDANYSLQADVNDDGTVDVDDFLAFIGSFGRTAVGPSTKPLVLLPGINENAEFALSLGSERVVAGELVAVDVSLANVAAVMGYGFTLNYDVDKFEFISAVPADEDLLKSTGGETPLFHHLVADGQVEVVNGVVNGTAVSGGGDIVRFVFRVLYEFEDNARFEIADGLVFDPSQLSNPAVIAGVLELQSTPREFALHQNFPNPFNPDTTIKYELAESADVTLQIYNVLGQVVRTLVASEAQNAGRYQIRWNGMDDRGVSVSSGVYFYRISAEGKFQNVRKLMLLK